MVTLKLGSVPDRKWSFAVTLTRNQLEDSIYKEMFTKINVVDDLGMELLKISQNRAEGELALWRYSRVFVLSLIDKHGVPR
jgi:hypothetical protein